MIERKTFFYKHPDIIPCYILQWRKPPLYPTTEENLFRCIPQQIENSSILSQNARNAVALYPTTAKKLKHQHKFFSKINFTHESGSQVEQSDEKNWTSITTWYYPFKSAASLLDLKIV